MRRRATAIPSSVSGEVMTIIASTAASAAEPFTPKWMEGKADAPIFFIRAGNVIERELMEAQLSGPSYRAGETWPWEKQAALIDGLKAIAGDDAAQLIVLAETSDIDDPAEAELLEQARALIGQHYAPYRDLLAQEERRRAILPIVAFCRYCVRWEGLDTDMKRGADGLIDPASLLGIDPIILRSAGFEAYNRQYAVGERKNSDAPSKSGADLKTSPSAEPSEKAGSSTGSDTPKTPD